MLTLSNGLSFFRAPLAFLFLQENSTLRVLAIFLAMLTDSIDGYVARRNCSTSRFGAILDPVMDKFFVYFALTVFYLEGRLAHWEIGAMLTRDLSLGLYGFWTWATGRWEKMTFRPVRWGKISTALQFVVLIGLALNLVFSWYVYGAFIAMGMLACLELLQLKASEA